MRGQKRKGPRRISDTCSTVRSAPAGLRTPGAGSSRALDVLQTFPILDAGSTVRPPREIPGASTPTARGPWMFCRPSRSLMPAALSDLPGRSPEPRRRQLAGPGCIAAFRIPAADSSVRTPRQIPGTPGAGNSPALDVLQVSRSSPPVTRSETPGSPSDPHCRQLDQSTRQISEAPGTGNSPALDVLQPSGSSAPAARSKAPGSPPNLRRQQHGQRRQEALRISNTCSTVRTPANLRSPGAGSSIRAPSGSLKHRSRRLALLGVLQPSGSSAPAARSAHQGTLRSTGAGTSPAMNALQDLPEPRRQQHGQSTRRISGASAPAARS